MKTGKAVALFAISVFLFLCAAIVSVSTGSGGTDFAEIADFICGNGDETIKTIFWQIRMPKLFAAILCGVCLSLSGAGMQSLFRNPLADPGVVGVSAGAALGAVLGITVFSAGAFWTECAAMFFAISAAAGACALGLVSKKISPLSILLGGIAVNAFCSAGVGYFMYTVRDAGLRGFVFWSLGSVSKCDWTDLAFASIFAIPSCAVILMSARKLDIMQLGFSEAYHAGVNAKAFWGSAMCACAAAAASSVAICGTIAFVGLVVPHAVRLVAGAKNGILLPLSAIWGALLVTAADTLCTVVSPTDPVPIGVLTSLLGVPFFAVLLGRKGK